MFGLVYVILPHSDVPPAEAVAASLARFKRGGRDNVPDDWLAWHDRTAEVQDLYRTRFTFTLGSGVRIEGGDAWLLDIKPVQEAMAKRDVSRWTVRFADIEPDLTRFAQHYLYSHERHPVTQGFGHWLNPLGQWDWWDLGGRFDGVITGQSARGRRAPPRLSSGPCRGRAALETLSDALGAQPESPLPLEDIRADDNVELVSRLREELRAGREKRLPTDLLLPPQAVPDEMRWLTSWPEIKPPEAAEMLGLPATALWRQVVDAAYTRFSDHWAAGVAFHF